MINWHKVLTLATRHLSMSSHGGPSQRTWCAWTTFERLGRDAGYWTAPLPQEAELFEAHTSDGGTWGQPFPYSEIAHLIIPRRFYWEEVSADGFSSSFEEQDVETLSRLLAADDVPHRLTELVLEIKLY